MSADPRECRKRALLARNVNTPEHKAGLIDLAQSWINLAIEIERTHALLEGHPPPANDASVERSGKPN
jgi:hypothetical protein